MALLQIKMNSPIGFLTHFFRESSTADQIVLSDRFHAHLRKKFLDRGALKTLTSLSATYSVYATLCDLLPFNDLSLIVIDLSLNFLLESIIEESLTTSLTLCTPIITSFGAQNTTRTMLYLCNYRLYSFPQASRTSC